MTINATTLLARRRDAGFTLLELLITVTIATALLVLGLPSMQQALNDNRMTAQANDLATALNLARSEAVKRKLRVSVCPSSDGANCAGPWDGGWIVFTDADADGQPDEVLRVGDASFNGILLQWDNPNNYVSYVPTGEIMPIPGDSGAAGGTFTFSDAAGAETTLNVNEFGRVKVNS